MPMTKEELALVPPIKPKDVFERAKVDHPSDPELTTAMYRLIGNAAEMTTETMASRVLEFEARATAAENECTQLRAAVKKACANARSVEQRCIASANKSAQLASAHQKRAEALEAQLKAGQYAREEEQAAAASQSTELTNDDLSVLVGQRTEQPG